MIIKNENLKKQRNWKTALQAMIYETMFIKASSALF